MFSHKMESHFSDLKNYITKKFNYYYIFNFVNKKKIVETCFSLAIKPQHNISSLILGPQTLTYLLSGSLQKTFLNLDQKSV